MKLNDRLFVTFNKKPPKPYQSYIYVTATWLAIGGIFGATLLTVIAGATESWQGILVIIIGLIAMLSLGWAAVKQDKTNGNYNAIAKQGRQYWNDRADKLGMFRSLDEHRK